MKFSIGAKISLGFLLMVVLTIVQGILSLDRFQQASTLGQQVKGVRVPTALTAADLERSIHQSLSALRGWMLIDNPELKEARAKAFADIHKDMADLEKSLTEANERESLTNLLEAKVILKEFGQVVEQIENLAHTIENTPALEVFFANLAPEADKVNQAITEMIYRESKRSLASQDPVEIKQSKQLLKAMSDFNNSFSLSVNDIRSYLMNGDQAFQKSYTVQWQKNNGAFANLDRSAGEGMLEEKQKDAFNRLKEARFLVEKLALTIFDFKKGDQFWNLGVFLLREEAIPLADKLVTAIENLAHQQEKAMVLEMAELDHTIQKGEQGTWLALIILTALGVITAFFITRLITQPLKRVEKTIVDISAGHLTQRMTLPTVQDEIHAIAHQVNQMTESLERSIRGQMLQAHTVDACVRQLQQVRSTLMEDSNRSLEVTRDLAAENAKLGQGLAQMKDSVAQASENMNVIAEEGEGLSHDIHTIASASEQANTNVTSMAAAAEEMTANVSEVKQNLEQVNQSVSTVASAVEEMNATLAEVRKRCLAATEQSKDANTQAQAAQTAMSRLGQSAREINKVVGMINNIAEQTKMLALNAAIEAAGAGEAGKGFAVVANEVKELARQTADATRMISAKVEEIRTNTQDAGRTIGNIVDSITRIHASNDEITHAVDEQSNTTHEIARSMAEVARAAEAVTHNTRELQEAADEVARSAGDAATGTREIAKSCSDAAEAARQVAHKAAETKDYIRSILSFAERTEQATGSDKMMLAFHLSSWLRGSVAYFGLITRVLED
ncbi:MAG: MCP four helix bundle domain-containing protein, partial [Magnetococcales bacterium]|nr:MCP four helix bundle domain-containing protein [Magnetococcales bacterium]